MAEPEGEKPKGRLERLDAKAMKVALFAGCSLPVLIISDGLVNGTSGSSKLKDDTIFCILAFLCLAWFPNSIVRRGSHIFLMALADRMETYREAPNAVDGLWNLWKPVSLCSSLLVSLLFAIGSAQLVIGWAWWAMLTKKKLACQMFMVPMLAFFSQIGYQMVPVLFAAYPRMPAGKVSFVETPQFRAQNCRPDNIDELRLTYGVLCEPVEPTSWEEAEIKAWETLSKMDMAQRHSLMQGTGWQAIAPRQMPILPAIPRRGHYMGNTPAIPELGVPALKMHDAGNGFRNMPGPLGKTGTTIMWPSSLSFGATWDVHLVRKIARAIGQEYRGKGSNVILGPSVQVHRTARNGRNFEYMSGEDPYLGARLTEAYVKGVQSEGVIATLKHYAFNEQETGRMQGNSVVDEKTAWELYYPPFEAGVAAGAGAVMCSYNKVNGTGACNNEGLLLRDLKTKMGFRGFVMSDWWALHQAPEESVPAGFDMEMPGRGFSTYFFPDDLRAFENNVIENPQMRVHTHPEWMVLEPARRILAAAHKMHLFEQPSCELGEDCEAALYSDQRDSQNEAIARTGATESVILLLNDAGILPLRASDTMKKVAFVGHAINAPSMSSAEVGMAGDYYSGGGSGHTYLEQDQFRTPLQSLGLRAKEGNWEMSSNATNDVNFAAEACKGADVIVVHTAATAEEGNDRASLSLDQDADDLIANLKIRFPWTPIVVMVQAPATVLMPWRAQVSAIVMQFLGGEFTGDAWASVLFGDVSPSGKLPLVIPKDERGIIEPTGFMQDKPEEMNVTYDEGVFTSYRHKNAAELAAFPFGHGLAYTNFSYDAPVQLATKDCDAFACVAVNIKNIGGGASMPAKEVAQAYVEFPPEAEQPKIQLKGFHKTSVLEVGQAEKVIFKFTERDFSIYRGSWQKCLQDIKVHIGSSSADLRQTIALKLS